MFWSAPVTAVILDAARKYHDVWEGEWVQRAVFRISPSICSTLRGTLHLTGRVVSLIDSMAGWLIERGI